MTKERARYILDNMRPFGEFRYAFRHGSQGAGAVLYEDGITEAEDKAIRDLWEHMPGYTCYYDAVNRIARAEDNRPTFALNTSDRPDGQGEAPEGALLPKNEENRGSSELCCTHGVPSGDLCQCACHSPLLAQNASEAQRLTYAGRKTELLREAKTFDESRLEKSPLFAEHQRQGKLL